MVLDTLLLTNELTVFAKRDHLGANLDFEYAYDLNALFFLLTTHFTVLRLLVRFLRYTCIKCGITKIGV